MFMVKKKVEKPGTNVFTNTLSIIKNNLAAFIIGFFSSLLIYSFLYGLWIIPFLNFGIMRMSPVTFFDYLFIFLLSLITASIVSLMKYESRQKMKSKSFASIGAAAVGFISTVCPICQGVTFIALGSTIANIPLGPIIPYLGIIKLASVGLLLLALYLRMDSLYTRTCLSCKITKKLEKGK